MLPLPIFITNFKNYEQATGARALELALVHERVAKDTGVSIGVCVSATDIFRVASEVSIPVFSQHVDPIDYGKFTGHVLPQGVKRAGAFGTLLNHSERRLENDVLKNSVSCAQKASLMRIVCAESVEEVEGFAGFGPDFLAFEPPELIGSTTASVASESPRSIADCVAVSRDIPVLVDLRLSIT